MIKNTMTVFIYDALKISDLEKFNEFLSRI